jgi:hypothetical protein
MADSKPFDWSLNPYVEWWRTHEGLSPRFQGGPKHDLGSASAPDPFAYYDAMIASGWQPQTKTNKPNARSFRAPALNLPIQKTNTRWMKDQAAQAWLKAPSTKLIPALDPDTVILGIIDIGIPLGHARFRLNQNQTRFLLSWQQSANSTDQDHLPFGQELYAEDIDKKVAQHTKGSILDEEAFNREAGLVDPLDPLGARDLDHRLAHGAHVLDLAAGLDWKTEGQFAQRLRIISVNLPPQVLHGSAGEYLQYFAAWGLLRIVGLADALWKRDHSDKEAGGFPIALNLSFGMQAGPKDGSEPLERLMVDLIKAREQIDDQTKRPRRPPLSIQMPAGNSNQMQCAAHFEKAGKLSLPWRIQPADQTSNYVEVWSKLIHANRIHDLQIEAMLTSPVGETLKLTAAPIGYCVDLEDHARICCLEHPIDAGGNSRIVFLFMVGPTAELPRVMAEGGKGSSASSRNPASCIIPPAPAGLWEVVIEDPGGLGFDAYVQSDQSLMPHSSNGRYSYFDHPHYEKYLECGRLRDSVKRDWTPAVRDRGPVTRWGTHNALATADEIRTIGGFRIRDDSHALYSSTSGTPKDDEWNLPSEEGYAHPGLLESGARSGASIRYSGTSMATGLATRWVAKQMLQNRPIQSPAVRKSQVTLSDTEPDKLGSEPLSWVPKGLSRDSRLRPRML